MGKMQNISYEIKPHTIRTSKKEAWRSEYSNIGTEKKRLKYLGYWDSLMGKNCVTRTVVTTGRIQESREHISEIFKIFYCVLCKRVYEISRLVGYKRKLKQIAELSYYEDGCSLGKPRKDCPYCAGTNLNYKQIF